MTAVVTTRDLSKKYGSVTALDRVNISVPENTICGLLGRNGAGKTTLMQILTAQNYATAGTAQVFGQDPWENDSVLTRVSFTKEAQRYPDYFKVRHALQASAVAYPNWDAAFARLLLEEFRLPLDRPAKKLSRGMFSALGIVVGLASRAPLTMFDEAHIGLDANSRQLFYDHLIADYAEHPRSILVSSHLIDEIGDLLEHVLILDEGRLIVQEPAEVLRGRAATITGPAAAVDEFAAGLQPLHREQLAGVARTTVLGPLTDEQRAQAIASGLDLDGVPLQQLVVRLTNSQTLKEASR